MTDENNIKEVNNYWKPLFINYAKKLGYDDEKVEMYFEILSTVKTILDRNDVHAKSMQWDRQGVSLKDGKVILPDGMEKVLQELVRENQINNIFVPEEHGGLGFTSFMVGPLAELIAKYDFPMEMLALFSVTVMDPLLSNYNDAYEPIIKKLAEGETLGYGAFTEANAGSNLQAVRSTSELVGDEYVLNGSKLFITNGGYAETGLFLARNMVDGKMDGHNVFVVDGLDNITTTQLEYKSGIKASPTAQLNFDNVTVPKEYLIGKAGKGYNGVIERLMGMRSSLGFQASAAAKRAYELSVNYANTREQFNKTIINFPDVKRKINAMEGQIKRMDEYNQLASYSLDRYYRGWIPSEVGAGGKNSLEKTAAKLLPGIVRGGIVHYFISSLKIYSSEIVNYLLYDAQQIFGGMGFIAETEINKIARDVRILSIFDGTSEIHNWIIKRSMKAIDMLPKFKKPYSKYDEETIYETMLFARFPELKSRI